MPFAAVKHRIPPLFANTEVVRLLDNGDPKNRFDIVMLAEGFTAAELPQFDALCQQVMLGFLQMPAFAAVQHLLNFHAVKTVSNHSEVDDPTIPVYVDTALNVSAYFNGAHTAGYVGSNSPLIYAAVRKPRPCKTST